MLGNHFPRGVCVFYAFCCLNRTVFYSGYLKRLVWPTDPVHRRFLIKIIKMSIFFKNMRIFMIFLIFKRRYLHDYLELDKVFGMKRYVQFEICSFPGFRNCQSQAGVQKLGTNIYDFQIHHFWYFPFCTLKNRNTGKFITKLDTPTCI